MFAPNGSYTWTEVSTDAQGNSDSVWLTTLLQCLQLNLGESPFYASYGIPAEQSVVQQLWPDYNVLLTQQQFAIYFANLVISKLGGSTPEYRVSVMTHQGQKITAAVPQ